MESTISISEILGNIYDGAVEVCATADANYDAREEKVTVKLEAFTRRVLPVCDGRREHDAWLPGSQSVTEHLPREEALSFTKDVFHSWLRRVRNSVPDDAGLRS